MKNTVTGPSMVAARTGIVTACNLDFPSDVCTVWTVFARHGLGNSASGNDGTTHVAATDLPTSCGGGGGGCSSSTTSIASGSTLSGTLATSDCTTTAGNGSSGGYYDDFTFAATAGQTATISLSSSSFDTYIRLYNGSGTQVAIDDDSGGGTNSLLVYSVPATGNYTIRTTSYGVGQTGSYSVSLTLAGGGGGGGGGELLTNGGFEGSTAPWVLSGSAVWSTGSFPHSGTGYTIIASANNNSGAAYQQVSIPSGGSPSLRFWLNVSSSETTTTTQYDKLFVEVRNTSGTLLTTLATYSNLNKATAGVYTQRGAFSLASYAGQTVRIQFRATNDSSLATSFRVDDASVQ